MPLYVTLGKYTSEAMKNINEVFRNGSSGTHA